MDMRMDWCLECMCPVCTTLSFVLFHIIQHTVTWWRLFFFRYIQAVAVSLGTVCYS